MVAKFALVFCYANDSGDVVSRRAAIDQPISRESSGDPNLIGDRAAHPVCDH